MQAERFDESGAQGADRNPVSCAWVQTRLFDYVDGELAFTERLNVEAHLEVCPACHTEMIQRRMAENALASALSLVPSPGDLRPEFYARLAAQPTRQSFWTGWRIAVPSLALGALALVVLRPLLFSPTATDPKPQPPKPDRDRSAALLAIAPRPLERGEPTETQGATAKPLHEAVPPATTAGRNNERTEMKSRAVASAAFHSPLGLSAQKSSLAKEKAPPREKTRFLARKQGMGEAEIEVVLLHSVARNRLDKTTLVASLQPLQNPPEAGGLLRRETLDLRRNLRFQNGAVDTYSLAYRELSESAQDANTLPEMKANLHNFSTHIQTEALNRTAFSVAPRAFYYRMPAGEALAASAEDEVDLQMQDEEREFTASTRMASATEGDVLTIWAEGAPDEEETTGGTN